MDLKKFHINVQRWVRNWALTNAIRHEFTEAIIAASNLNNTINATDVRNENGKRKFTLKYVPPVCELEFDCSTNICDNGVTTKPKQEDFIIKQCSKSPVLEISQEDLQDLDGIATNEYFLELLTNNLAAARKTLNMQLIAYTIQNLGRFPDGNATKTVSLFDVTKKVIDPFGNVYIQNTFTDANLGTPFVVGGSHIQFIRSVLPISGQNSDGQNTGGLPYSNYFYDKMVNEAFGGGEHMIAFDPQVLKFIAFAQNTGRYATDLKGFAVTDIESLFKEGIGNNFYWGSIIDPANGLLWDLDVVYQPCANDTKYGSWKFQFGLLWDIFFMPDRVCNEPSVNGVFHFTGCDMVPTTCPEVTPPTPVAKRTFTWTPPSDCYPRFIKDIVIGGKNYTVDANVANLDELIAVLNAVTGYVFTKNGSSIEYEGYSALTGSINGIIAITFYGEPSGVTVTPGTFSIAKTESKQFAAVVAPADANQAVTWSITSATGLAVNSSGLVTTTGSTPAGNYTVTATSVADGSKAGTATLTVTE